MMLSSPRSVTKNFISWVSHLHRTCRSMNLVIIPALLCVPSIFHMERGFFNWRLPIFICFRVWGLMKLSVAPESMRTSFSAFLCEDCKRVGIFKLLYLHANMFFTPNARTQTDRFVHFKNPDQLLRPPALPLLYMTEEITFFLLASPFPF